MVLLNRNLSLCGDIQGRVGKVRFGKFYNFFNHALLFVVLGYALADLVGGYYITAQKLTRFIRFKVKNGCEAFHPLYAKFFIRAKITHTVSDKAVFVQFYPASNVRSVSQ